MDAGQGRMIEGRDMADLLDQATKQNVDATRIEAARLMDRGVFRVGEAVHVKGSVFCITDINGPYIKLKLQPGELREPSAEEKRDLKADAERWRALYEESERKRAQLLAEMLEAHTKGV